MPDFKYLNYLTIYRIELNFEGKQSNLLQLQYKSFEQQKRTTTIFCTKILFPKSYHFGLLYTQLFTKQTYIITDYAIHDYLVQEYSCQWCTVSGSDEPHDICHTPLQWVTVQVKPFVNFNPYFLQQQDNTNWLKH